MVIISPRKKKLRCNFSLEVFTFILTVVVFLFTVIPITALSQSYREGVVLVKFRQSTELLLNTTNVSPSIFSASVGDIGIEKIVPMFAAHNVYFNSTHPVRLIPELARVKHEAISRMYLVHFPATLNVLKAVRQLSADPLVEYAEPRSAQHATTYQSSDPLSADPLVEHAETERNQQITAYQPNDPYVSQQSHFAPIKMFDAWDITKGDSTIIISIDDNGMQLNHPDLTENIYQNPGEIGLDASGNDKRTNRIDDDNNGFIDDWHGWDFGGANGNSSDNNPTGGSHGTLVAGLAGSRTDNGIGIAGVGFRCKIMPIKTASDANIGSLMYGYEGIVYAADNGASIINCSWWGGAPLRAEQEIIDYVTAKGALVVAGAGDDNKELFNYPASYNHVLSVTSTRNTDKITDFSDYGIRVDITAPGWTNYTTYPVSSYKSFGGTALSTPLVAGVCGLVKSRFPQLSPDQIAERVRITADVNDINYDAVHKKLMGHGRLNAYRAVSDSNVKSIRIDSIGINDITRLDAIAPGDTIILTARFKNYLDPTGVATTTLVNYKNSSSFTILSSSSTVDPMGTLDVRNAQTPYKIVIAPNAKLNTVVKLRIDIVDGSYNDYDYFEFLVRPTYKNFDQNDVIATVTSNGCVGFNDMQATQGSGVLYRNSDNLLFEGSFMVGIDGTHVVDVARNAASGANQAKDADFTEQTFLTLQTPGENGTAQSGRCSFTDSLAPSANKIGVKVSSYAYEQKTPSLENALVIEQTITNRSSATLTSLYAGYFFDWDIGANGANNITEYHEECNFASVRLNANNPVVGVTVIPQSKSLPINFYAFDNKTVNDGFTKAEKWTALSSGTTASSKQGPTDISHVISAGPFTLAPGDSITIPFALFGGTSLEQLRQTANILRNETCDPITVKQIENREQGFILQQNYPNPFSRTTVIPMNGKGLFEVRDMLGRVVYQTKIDNINTALIFDGSNLRNGLYEYSLSDGVNVQFRMMVVMK